jgi:Type II CAAX prenyl endopeptidase Rce1-like
VTAVAPTENSIVQSPVRSRDSAWTDLVLTLPILILYHIGVVFLPVRNAADWVTSALVEFADKSLFYYLLMTVTVGAVVIVFFLIIGQKRALAWQRFAMIAVEGVLYAVVLRLVAGYVVGQLRLAPDPLAHPDLLTGLVMSLGAGFYEELIFRVGLFALLGHLVTLTIVSSPSRWKNTLFWLGWALTCSMAFSAWHHVGELGEPFTLNAFVFRWVSGLVFTAILSLRGFATVVWTHTLYDIWVMVL